MTLSYICSSMHVHLSTCGATGHWRETSLSRKHECLSLFETPLNGRRVTKFSCDAPRHSTTGAHPASGREHVTAKSLELRDAKVKLMVRERSRDFVNGELHLYKLFHWVYVCVLREWGCGILLCLVRLPWGINNAIWYTTSLLRQLYVAQLWLHQYDLCSFPSLKILINLKILY